MNQQKLNTLIYWVKERSEILRKKEAGEPKPWTEDPILQNYRFCNVYREDDTVSRWIRTNWSNVNSDHPNLVLAMGIARFINVVETLSEVGFPKQWRPAEVQSILNQRAAEGKKVWTSAYIVSTNGNPEPKSQYIVKILGYLHDAHIVPAGRLSQMHSNLTAIMGIGDFMAGQIIADLKNTEGCQLMEADDWFTWSCPGPGSARGMNRLQGRPLNSPLARRHWASEILDVREEVQQQTEMILCAQDVQNCLCEFDKYERVANGEGTPRQRYPGGS